MVKLKDIFTNPANPRIIKDAKFQKLVKSIDEFPKMMELRPIIVDSEGMILGGNMRYKALKDLGYKEIPDTWVKRADDLTEGEIRRFTIADNVGFGEWDYELLANEWDVSELNEWGLDLPDFENETIEVEEDDYEIPEQIETDIILGDLFEIGEHRLLCGDSTDSDLVAKLMRGVNADMVFTDPPYDLDFDYTNTINFSKDAHIFIFNNDRAIIRQLQKSPFVFKNFFIFYHSGTAIPQEGGNESFLDHILISHEISGKPKVRFNKGDGLRTVIKGEYRRSEEHKHQKPNSILEAIIRGYSNENNIILDFFAGGGNLFSVAHQLKRICYGIEIEPKYCQVIIERMVKLDKTLTIKKNGEDFKLN